MSNKKCCKNCDNCTVRHAGRNNVYHECTTEDGVCIVEPNDEACEKYKERKD